MKSMVAIIDSGSTGTSISSRALMAMAAKTPVNYSKTKVQLVGANGTMESTGSVILTGVYCPAPGLVKPFSVDAHINPHLPVDLLIGNDLSEIVGLSVHDCTGRQLRSYPLSTGRRDPFSVFTVKEHPTCVEGEARRAFTQSSRQSNRVVQNFCVNSNRKPCKARFFTRQPNDLVVASKTEKYRKESSINDPMSWTGSMLNHDCSNVSRSKQNKPDKMRF